MKPRNTHLVADPRDLKTDRYARQRKSAQDQGSMRLPRSKKPRYHSAPKKPLTSRRHILKMRVDSYILGALSSWPLQIVASWVVTDE